MQGGVGRRVFFCAGFFFPRSGAVFFFFFFGVFFFFFFFFFFFLLSFGFFLWLVGRARGFFFGWFCCAEGSFFVFFFFFGLFFVFCFFFFLTCSDICSNALASRIVFTISFSYEWATCLRWAFFTLDTKRIRGPEHGAGVSSFPPPLL